jgi:hypothetical protein
MWRFNVCVIVTVILKVLQLFVVTTSEDQINRFTNPNPRLNHWNTWQYCFYAIVLHEVLCLTGCSTHIQCCYFVGSFVMGLRCLHSGCFPVPLPLLLLVCSPFWTVLLLQVRYISEVSVRCLADYWYGWNYLFKGCVSTIMIICNLIIGLVVIISL